MPPLTLVDVTVGEPATATTLDTRARAALEAAQKEQRAAEDALGKAQSEFAKQAKADSDLRRDLAAASDDMPADASGLADDIELSTVKLRALGVAVARATRRATDARRRADAAGARARQAAAALADAAGAKAAADTRKGLLDAADAALAAAPLKNVKAAANTELSGQPLTDADARIAADIPADLLARARARLDLATAELVDAAAVAAAAVDGTEGATTARSGLPAATAKARAELDAAERAYLDTLDGQVDLERAKAMIVAVTAAPAMSAGRKARIAARKPAAAVVAAEKTRDDKLEIARQKRRAYEAKWLAALVAKPDADPATDNDVKTAKGELDTAETDVKAAETALDAPPAPTAREAFGRWEATIPDETWAALVQLEAARSTLERLDATVPADLRTALTNAEDLFAQALRADALGARTVAALAALATDRAGAAEAAARTTSDLSAARGDA